MSCYHSSDKRQVLIWNKCYWLKERVSHKTIININANNISNKFFLYTGGHPGEIEQRNRSSFLEKALHAYCNIYYSNKQFKSK